MCLDQVLQREDPAASGKGFKVFARTKGELGTACWGDWDKPFTTDQWLDSRDWSNGWYQADRPGISVPKQGYTSYKAGWHIFTNRAEAIRWARELWYHRTAGGGGGSLKPDAVEVREVAWEEQLARGTNPRLLLSPPVNAPPGGDSACVVAARMRVGDMAWSTRTVKEEDLTTPRVPRPAALGVVTAGPYNGKPMKKGEKWLCGACGGYHLNEPSTTLPWE
jgi:hypothetical protein